MYSIEELKASKGCSLYHYAKQIIPGGTQLLSKRPEMFAPDIWPSYYKEASGTKVIDLDGREFIDMSIMSVGASILGYSDKDVDKEVIKSIKKGVTSSLVCPEEVELSKRLLELHPWFDMVRFARSGGEAMSIAVRIARAHSKKDKILFSGYHGWCDWYLASNILDKNNLDGHLMGGLDPNGVPNSLVNSAIPFNANSIESLLEKIKNFYNEIGVIVIEPARGEDAPEGYLKNLKELADDIGAVLIFDEITSGFRKCVGGSHKVYGINPHMAVFAKSMANGYAMSAVVGQRKVMQSAQDSFISSTNWTERIGPTAALATIDKYIDKKVDIHINKAGERVKRIWVEAAKSADISIKVSGISSLASFAFNYENNIPLQTFFTVEMLKRGFLGFRQFKPSYSHQDKDLELYNIAVKEIFKMISRDIDCKKTNYQSQHSGFQRLTSE